MTVENGMYVVRFRAPAGVMGGGVVILGDGKLRGGDSMVAYLGSYRDEGGEMIAELQAKVHTNVPGMAPIFGAADATVMAKGKMRDGRGLLIGTSPQAPGVQLQVEIERYD
jgi:hypothetical protein